jgi:D-sedoheptulose 7-phosphate isomerase
VRRAGGGKRVSRPRAKRAGASGASRTRVDRVRDIFRETLELTAAVYARERETIERIADLIAGAALAGRTVFWAGNGGSAAEAQHLAAEFVVRFVKNRRALPSLSLHADTSVLTAAANDLGFERVFARQLEALGRRGDVLVALTTSGRSANVIAAVGEARRRGMKVVGLTGAKGAAFARRCDLALVVPSDETARVQEIHMLVGHVCCDLAEALALAEDRRAAGRRRPGKRSPR